MNNNAFWPVTGRDFGRSIAASRRSPNRIMQGIRSKLALAGLLAPMAVSAAMPVTESLDIGRMVEVLRQLENGPADNPWQFTEATWHAYSKVPIKTASPQEHLRVAWSFVQGCIRQCVSLDWPITAERIAILFNAGYGTIVRNELKPEHHDYARRADNLYHSKP